jgi:hypothetical protein
VYGAGDHAESDECHAEAAFVNEERLARPSGNENPGIGGGPDEILGGYGKDREGAKCYEGFGWLLGYHPNQEFVAKVWGGTCGKILEGPGLIVGEGTPAGLVEYYAECYDRFGQDVPQGTKEVKDLRCI